MSEPSTNNLASPCVSNCCLDDKDMCLGCFRMMDEILQWGQADDKLKQEILVNCGERKKERA